MKRILILCISIFQLNLIYAQKIEYMNYTWDKSPVFPSTDSVKADKGAIFLLERKISEIYINRDQYFEELSIFHRQVKVLTTDALASYNRFYVHLDNVLEIVQIKARFVKKDGTIIELPKESIKEVENLENKGNYKVFAVEGAEVGGIIEYYYILRKKYNPFGSFVVQGEEPILRFEAIFIYPSKLEYRFKSYNGLSDFKTTSKNEDQTISTLSALNISGIDDEKYSSYDANLMRFEYTLAYNRYKSPLRAYSWNVAATFFWNGIYDLSKDESKAVDNYLKIMKINGLLLNQKIRSIEGKVKEEISISKDLPTNLSIDKIIELKQAKPEGVTKLLVSLYNRANINVELVLTTDRTKRIFDPEFNSMNFLDEYMLYFPDIDDYIFPDKPNTRLGIMLDNFTGNYGVFYHPVKLNEKLQTLAYDLRFIPYENYLKNADSLFIKLTIDPVQLQMEVDTRRVFLGNLAQNFQSFWDQVPAERKEEIINKVFNMGSDNNRLKSYNVQGATTSDIGINPLVWNVVQIAPSLVEMADNDIVVKIGEVIGEQSQLYREKERKLPVDVNNIMHYYRIISLTVPAGYKVTNPDDLNMKVEMMNNGKVSCAFTSEPRLEDNTLKVIIHEYYTEQSYPVSRFEEFRAVINAAADFNKKTVVLTKI